MCTRAFPFDTHFLYPTLISLNKQRIIVLCWCCCWRYIFFHSIHMFLLLLMVLGHIVLIFCLMHCCSMRNRRRRRRKKLNDMNILIAYTENKYQEKKSQLELVIRHHLCVYVHMRKSCIRFLLHFEPIWLIVQFLFSALIL